MRLPTLPFQIRSLRRLLPAAGLLLLFLAPMALLVERDGYGSDRGAGEMAVPAVDAFSQTGPFALGAADLERSSWSWARAKDLSADIWEAQLPGEGVYASYYCGCAIERRGSSGGRVDLDSCGYVPRSNPERASRLEWEHVVPASILGRRRSCWTQGAAQCVDRAGVAFRGRDCCMIADPAFALAATDPVNLVPAVGELNGDRSNYPFGRLGSRGQSYGSCPVRIDTNAGIVEPPVSLRGDIARIHAYMSRAYGLRLPRATAQTYRDWILADPVSAEEIRINQAIAMSGHRANPFVLSPGFGAVPETISQPTP